MNKVLRLKKSNCKNCYKCIRHCPVKSIRFSGNQAHIISEECILCGQCFVVCPQNAKEVADARESVKVLLQSDAPVYASIAPSFVAYFDDCGIESLREACKKLGFADVEETAVGATLVKREYEHMVEEAKQDIIITSCCHSVNLLIGKYYPELLSYLAPVVTPMYAHCQNLKERYPNAKTVFIGPCVSKKDEATRDDVVDAVMTFEELALMLSDKELSLTPNKDSNEQSKARLFPTVGGILKTMKTKEIARANGYSYLTVDGVGNCIAALDDIKAGHVSRSFIEMSACAGSCIGGPIMEKYHNSPLGHYQAVIAYAGKEDFDLPQEKHEVMVQNRGYIGVEQKLPEESEIKRILAQMGKTKPGDELNCGTCGYNTCREKAIAVIQGKADVSMCLPFLMEKTESFSNTILDNTPNGIVVVNDEYEVQQINKSAMQMLRISNPRDVMGDKVVRILDPLPFMKVHDGKEKVAGELGYYAEYDKYFEQTIVYDKTSHILVCLLRDVSEEELERAKKESISKQTVEIADKVVDKQMRIVQEIASLLGETAAETKIALTKLKESISNENQ